MVMNILVIFIEKKYKLMEYLYISFYIISLIVFVFYKITQRSRNP